MPRTHDISLHNAANKTGDFQTAYPGVSKGGKISIEELEEIFAQTGCVGLRFYLSLKDDDPDEVDVVFCGVDADGNDILGSEGILKNNTFGCPPNCGEANQLNHETAL